MGMNAVQVDGSLYVVYNMGLSSQPVGELEYKVNDGRYHVMRFTRLGQNASVQLDDRPPHFKHPPGQSVTPCHSLRRPSRFVHCNPNLKLGSRVVSVLDSGAEGPGFKSQPRRCRVTVLGKLLTPILPLFTKQQNW